MTPVICPTPIVAPFNEIISVPIPINLVAPAESPVVLTPIVVAFANNGVPPG